VQKLGQFLSLIGKGEIMGAEIIRRGLFAIQVCVPKDWTDQQIIEFAEEANPCGTERGWQIRRYLEEEANYQERGQCMDHENHVHLVLEA
jgi:hypothetical protein